MLGGGFDTSYVTGCSAIRCGVWLSSSMIRRQANWFGRDCSFSHRLTVAYDTPISSANCPWVSSLTPRRFFILRA